MDKNARLSCHGSIAPAVSAAGCANINAWLAVNLRSESIMSTPMRYSERFKSDEEKDIPTRSNPVNGNRNYRFSFRLPFCRQIVNYRQSCFGNHPAAARFPTGTPSPYGYPACYFDDGCKDAVILCAGSAFQFRGNDYGMAVRRMLKEVAVCNIGSTEWYLASF